MQQLPKRTATGRSRFWVKVRQQKYLLLMLLPAVILLIMFNYLPLTGWYMAFSDYKIGKPMFAGEFVGLEHFISVFRDSSDLGYLVRNTLVINLLNMFISPVAAITVALLLREVRWKAGVGAVMTAHIRFPQIEPEIVIQHNQIRVKFSDGTDGMGIVFPEVFVQGAEGVVGNFPVDAGDGDVPVLSQMLFVVGQNGAMSEGDDPEAHLQTVGLEVVYHLLHPFPLGVELTLGGIDMAQTRQYRLGAGIKVILNEIVPTLHQRLRLCSSRIAAACSRLVAYR